MRVLICVSEMPPIASGVARCAGKLACGLRALGHEVDVISSADFGRVSVGEFRFSAFVRRWPRLAQSLSSYDVVNVHGPVPTLSDAFLALAQTLAPIRRPPIVYTHHCSIDLEGWEHACRAYNRLHRALAGYADRVVTTTQSYRDMMSVDGGPPVTVIPWGVDYEAFATPPRRPRPLDQPLRVLFVGQMRPYKGIGNLLRAVAGERRLQVALVGSGPLEAYYRRQAYEVGARNVRFLGRVPDRRLETLYGEHDVVVLPSTTQAEAFGLVLLEGMAAGCVPVASDLPGVRDVAGPTGMLVRPHDVDDLRRTLLELADDPHRTLQLANASQARARELGWEPIVRRYERVFHDALIDWRDTRALEVLPRAWKPPESFLSSVSDQFSASWSSLLLFDRSSQTAPRAGWGRVAVDELHTKLPRIAQYVARTGRPLLIGSDVVPQPVQSWLVRDDVGSALSVPVRSGRGTLVLNLSISSDERREFKRDDLATLVTMLAPRPANGRLTGSE